MNVPVIWRPSNEYLARANLRRFMDANGIRDYCELIRRSTEDTDWFWDAALADLGVEWYRPYSQLLDDSRGFPWCRWFVSGQINVVHNCVDRHAGAVP